MFVLVRTCERTERIDVVCCVVVTGVPQFHGESQRPLAPVKRHVFARPNVHLSTEVEHEDLHTISRSTSNLYR